MIAQNPFITIEELAGNLSLTDGAINKSIAKLKQKGLLRRVGPDKGGHWDVISK